MDKKRIFLIVQSILCVVIALMLAIAAIGIYREGLALKATDPLSWIYTREKTAAALVPVLPLIILSLIMTIVGLVMGIRDGEGHKIVKDTEWLRDMIADRVASASDEMKAERAKQKKMFYAGWAVFALSMIPILLYIANGDHFPNGDLESMFLSLIAHILPWIAIGLAALMISSVLQEKSLQREIAFAKEQIKSEKETNIKPVAKKKEQDVYSRLKIFRIALLVLACVLIVAGVFNGSANDVFGKAVNICTECIGLG
jgi:hypothetical protein